METCAHESWCSSLTLQPKPGRRLHSTCFQIQLSKYFSCYCRSWAVQTRPWSMRQVRRGEGRVFRAPRTHSRVAGQERGGAALTARYVALLCGQRASHPNRRCSRCLLSCPNPHAASPHPCRLPGPARIHCRSPGACFFRADKGSPGSEEKLSELPRFLKEEGVDQELSLRQSW